MSYGQTMVPNILMEIRENEYNLQFSIGDKLIFFLMRIISFYLARSSKNIRIAVSLILARRLCCRRRNWNFTMEKS